MLNILCFVVFGNCELKRIKTIDLGRPYFFNGLFGLLALHFYPYLISQRSIANCNKQ